ncbi:MULTISPECIES: hypothetical protein [unclassified Microbacterium]|uniref:hypothetical protein n=1 Tax=unclassified Microbacterium TaxID=2609290 RepID=UPI000D003D0C|nr:MULTISPECIES: hypothetical protein [unclassified Microbacterium]PQZ70221.1 hypothetical protein CQ031_19725 [Microbacterium sp. MYb40]
MTSDGALQAALDGLRVRVPASEADLEVLRAEIRQADAAVGSLLRAAAEKRQNAGSPRQTAGER